MPVSARREAAIGITVDPSKMDAGVEGARRKMRGLRKEVEDAEDGGPRRKKKKEKSFGEQAGSGGMIVAGALQRLGARATDGVIGMLEDSASSVFDVEKALVRLQITGNMSAGQLGAFRDQLTRVSNDTGLAKQAILDGTAAYIDLTGDVAGATKGMAQFARIAQASDTSMADVTSAAASMRDAMHISPDEYEAVFSGLINQGKQGAVTLKNMAGEFPSLLTRYARFGVTGKDAALEVGALFQVARKGFGTAEEASTGLAGMLDGIIGRAHKFEEAGVKVFDVGKDGTKTLRPVSKILEEIGKSRLAKDPELLKKAFGRVEGLQAYDMYRTHLDMLKEMEAAGQDFGTVQRDINTYSQSSAGRIEVAWNAVKNKFAEVFNPAVVETFANALESVGTVLGAIGSKLGDLFAKWQEIREATGDPHEAATDEAATFNSKSSKETLYAAQQAAARADSMQGASTMAHFVADDSGNFLTDAITDALLPGRRAMRAAENDRDRELANKLGRQAGYKAAREQVSQSSVFNVAGNAGAQLAGAIQGLTSAVSELAKNQTLKIDGKAVATAVADSPTHRRLPPVR